METENILSDACASASGSASGDASTGSGLVITDILYDPPGAATDEWVQVTNQGSAEVEMMGWTLEDEAGFTYVFPSFTLQPSASVKIHTGSGTDSATDLYWGRGSAVWNNGGDTVYLYDADAALVDEYGY